MGPMTSPGDTLDRIDNDNPAYGPGLCRWADKLVQNNNKGNNLKIIIPVTGEVFTAAQIAKLHGVQTKTVYKWIEIGYTPIEMLAGKKSKHLAALQTGLVKPSTPKAVKGSALKFRVPPPPLPPKDWEPTNEDIDHYNRTGEMLDSRYEERLAEHQEVVRWVIRHNAGLPQPTERPKLKYWKFSALNAYALFGPPESVMPVSPEALAKLLGIKNPSQTEGTNNAAIGTPQDAADDIEDEEEEENDELDPADYDPPNY